jgi:hypothetical protein
MTAIIIPFPSRSKLPPTYQVSSPLAVGGGEESASIQIGTLRDAAVKMGWRIPANPRRAAEMMAAELVRMALVMERAEKVARSRTVRPVHRRSANGQPVIVAPDRPRARPST